MTTRLTLTVDVAILGETNAQDDSSAIDFTPGTPFHESDLRGARFYFEGLVYPGGTIADEDSEFDISSATPIGSFFNVGVPIMHPQRPNPHLLSTSTFYLGGVVGDPDPFPLDQIVVHGVEHGTSPFGNVYTRAVLGGTGAYTGARGHVEQRAWGQNSTRILRYPEMPEPPKSPNYRFEFFLLD